MKSHELEVLRSLYSDLHFLNEASEEYIRKHPSPEGNKFIAEYRTAHIHNIRQQIKSYTKYMKDPLRFSLLTGEPRTIWTSHDDLSDGPTYFWIEPDRTLTDEEIEQIKEDNTYRCRSPYDCCGQKFTWAITARRTPVGIVFINHTAFDY